MNCWIRLSVKSHHLSICVFTTALGWCIIWPQRRWLKETSSLLPTASCWINNESDSTVTEWLYSPAGWTGVAAYHQEASVGTWQADRTILLFLERHTHPVKDRLIGAGSANDHKPSENGRNPSHRQRVYPFILNVNKNIYWCFTDQW